MSDYISTEGGGGWHIRVLTLSVSTKERLQPLLNVQSMVHPFFWLTCCKGALQHTLQVMEGGTMPLHHTLQRMHHAGSSLAGLPPLVAATVAGIGCHSMMQGSVHSMPRKSNSPNGRENGGKGEIPYGGGWGKGILGGGGGWRKF